MFRSALRSAMLESPGSIGPRGAGTGATRHIWQQTVSAETRGSLGIPKNLWDFSSCSKLYYLEGTKDAWNGMNGPDSRFRGEGLLASRIAGGGVR